MNYYNNNQDNEMVFTSPIGAENSVLKNLLVESVNPPKFKSKARIELDEKVAGVIGNAMENLPEGVTQVEKEEMELLCPKPPHHERMVISGFLAIIYSKLIHKLFLFTQNL